MIGACKATLDSPAAALAFVMGSPNFVIQRQARVSIAGVLQLEETVKDASMVTMGILLQDSPAALADVQMFPQVANILPIPVISILGAQM